MMHHVWWRHHYVLGCTERAVRSLRGLYRRASVMAVPIQWSRIWTYFFFLAPDSFIFIIFWTIALCHLIFGTFWTNKCAAWWKYTFYLDLQNLITYFRYHQNCQLTCVEKAIWNYYRLKCELFHGIRLLGLFNIIVC